MSPPMDGVTPWTVDVIIDEEYGNAYVYLPDGSVVVITAAQIAAKFTTLGATPVALKDLHGEQAIFEHFAAPAGTAIFPQFLRGWAETSLPKRSQLRLLGPRPVAKSLLWLKSLIPPSPAIQVYSPTTQASVALTSSLAAVDVTNAKITLPLVGAQGVVILEADIYYEITTSDTVLARMTGAGGGATSSSIDAILANAAVGNYPVHHTWVITGLTPGTTPAWQLYHQFRTATGVGALKAGGTGSTLRPPIALKATTY